MRRFVSFSLIDYNAPGMTNEKINRHLNDNENNHSDGSAVDVDLGNIDPSDENDPLIIKNNRLMERLDRL